MFKKYLCWETARFSGTFLSVFRPFVIVKRRSTSLSDFDLGLFIVIFEFTFAKFRDFKSFEVCFWLPGLEKFNSERFLRFFLPYNYGSCDRIVTWWSSGNFWEGVSYGFYRLSIPVNRPVEIG